MLCQNCKQKPAQVHFTKVVNDEKMEIHLCEECAREHTPAGFDNPFSINNFFAGLLDIPVGYSIKGTQIKQKAEYKCSACGLSFEEFKHSGKLGCAQCYTVFSDNITPILKRIHGNVYNSGKVPKRNGVTIKLKKEIELLREQLNTAVKQEEYEKAAQLRDKIKELEKSNSGSRR